MSGEEFMLEDLAAAEREIKERDDVIAELRGKLAAVRIREADRATAEGNRLSMQHAKFVEAVRKFRTHMQAMADSDLCGPVEINVETVIVYLDEILSEHAPAEPEKRNE